MSNPSRARRCQAFLAAAVIGISGVASIPLTAQATESPAHPADQQSPSGQKIEGATLSWNLNDSFVSYLKTPGTGGKIDADGVDNLDNAFGWSSGTGTFRDGKGEVALPGSLHFTAHNGAMDLTVRDLSLSIDGQSGIVYANIDSKNASGEMVQYGRIALGHVDLSGLNKSSDSLSAEAAKVTLTSQAAPAFGGRYKEGQELSPLTFKAPLSATGQPSTGQGEQTPSSARKIVSSDLKWGIKESFRKYIRGPIAKGTWEVSGGITDDNGSFGWGAGTGHYDPSTQSGEISYPGELHFTGHGGILDMRISNIRLKITNGQGSLIADVASNDPEGQPHIYTNSTLAKVDLSGATLTGGKVSVTNAKTTMTASGSVAFANFYSEGQELDALSFSAILDEAAGSDSPGGNGGADTSAPVPPINNGSGSGTSDAGNGGNAGTGGNAETGGSGAGGNLGNGDNSSAGNGGTGSVTPAEQNPAVGTADVKQSSTRKVVSSDLQWGVKESFRKYIRGPIAKGTWTVSGGVKDNGGVFNWGTGTGQYDVATKSGQIKYPGELHFTGHGGILDMKISNVRLQITNGEGKLVADVVSNDTDGKPHTYNNSVLATVDLSGATLNGDKISVTGAKTTITPSGAAAFADFYSAGTALDPLSFSATLGETVDSNPIDAVEDQGSHESATASDNQFSTSNGSDNGQGSSNGGAAQNAAGSGAQATQNGSASRSGGSSTNPGKADLKCVPVTVTETAKPSVSAANHDSAGATSSTSGTVSAASLNWGLKTSFRNYISGGIAKGKWDLSSVGYSNGTYNWSNGSGKFENGKGSVSFPGSVRFTGHKGILDLKISNLRLDIDGAKGTLYATVSSNNMEGKNKDYGEVALADVDVSGLKVEGGKISLDGGKTNLTKVGSEAFADFYQPGQELDPLSFSGSLSGGESRSVKPMAESKATVDQNAKPVVTTKTVYQGEGCEHLASTGAQSPAALAGIGAAILAVGTGAVLIARRRMGHNRP
ncbi:HtaA domain-containing protein [Rothia uropygialis]|uniref:HtaA domain-containing protein n=1 Tax=Kocuria sp. 36 TaxID=1415402 RepID=UPI00101C24EF|nr:HtaA domain-containing protein [Kocuria sp. 36]